MQLTVNEISVETDAQNLADLVAEHTDSTDGVAAALNMRVVPQSLWEDTALSAGDRIDILVAVQGG